MAYMESPAAFASPWGVQELSIDEIDMVDGAMSDLTKGLLILGAGIAVGVVLGGVVVVAAILIAA